MELPLLDFGDCVKDSPAFRDALRTHETAIDNSDQWIKRLTRECRAVISTGHAHIDAGRSFASTLTSYRAQRVAGQRLADDDIAMDTALERCGVILLELEEKREVLLNTLSLAFLDPLEEYRKKCNDSVRDAKKLFNKAAERYGSSLDRSLGISAKKKDSVVEVSELQLDEDRASWVRGSLSYVQVLKEQHETRKFDLGDRMIALLFSTGSFFHDGYESTNSRGPFLRDLSARLLAARTAFEAHKDATLATMARVETAARAADGPLPRSDARREGWLWVHKRGKAGLGSAWGKYYCSYEKSAKLFAAVDCDVVPAAGMAVESTIQVSREVTDRRHCFEVAAGDRTVVLQALSEPDRNAWLSVMGGLQPVKTIRRKKAKDEQLSEAPEAITTAGFVFVQRLVTYVEKNLCALEGVYRTSGQKSKFVRLCELAVEKNKRVHFEEEDPQTITSALKHYFREMPEPLLTFRLHQAFVDATKLPPDARRAALQQCVHKLPPRNAQVLGVVIAHLKRMSRFTAATLMGPSNFGVVFGPTLLRPEVESAAQFVDVRFQNAVVEHLIEDHDFIFLKTAYAAAATSESDVSAAAATFAASSQSPARVGGLRSRKMAPLPPCTTGNAGAGGGKRAPPPPPSSAAKPKLSTTDPPARPPPPVMLVAPARGVEEAGAAGAAGARSLSPRPAGVVTSVTRNGGIGVTFQMPATGQSVTDGDMTDINAANHDSEFEFYDDDEEEEEEEEEGASTDDAHEGSKPSDGGVYDNIYSVPPRAADNGGGAAAAERRPSTGAPTNKWGTKTSVRALYACAGEEAMELSFEAGDIITDVLPTEEEGWWTGTHEVTRERGMFPTNYVSVISANSQAFATASA